MLNLMFLGIGSAFHPALGNCCAFFKKQNTLYLLDCGCTAFSRLIEKNVLDHVEKITVLVTHTHADHIGSLGTLLSYCHHCVPLPVTIVHPTSAVSELLTLCGIRKERYTYCLADSWQDENISIRFLPVRHSASLLSFGMVIRDQDEAIYYSGDAAALPDMVEKDFRAGRISRIFQDTAVHSDGESHGVYAIFLEKLDAPLRSRFFPIHWDEDLSDRIVQDGFGMVHIL